MLLQEPSTDLPANGSSSVVDISAGEKSVEISDSKSEAILPINMPRGSKMDDNTKSVTVEEVLDKSTSLSKSYLRNEASSERNRDRDRYRERDRENSHDRERGRDSDRDREREKIGSRDKIKDKRHWSNSGV